MMATNHLLLCGAALLAFTAACADGGAPDGEASAVDGAIDVSLAPTSGQTASGTLAFSDSSGGVRITGRLDGLPADQNLGFHVHEIGDCSAPDASSAGEHFNPDLQPHGDPDDARHHAGDLPNLDVDADGVANVDVTLVGLSLRGPSERSVLNRAVVLHAGQDDFTSQPSGASGDRIACGVIRADAARVGVRSPGPERRPTAFHVASALVTRR